MAEKVGDMAMQGQWEYVLVRTFHISEDMTMHFIGDSCNILDEKGQQQANFGKKDGEVIHEVRPGNRCFILNGRIMFVKAK
jgi:hypothetical protein